MVTSQADGLSSAPPAPTNLAQTGLPPELLGDLALKMAGRAPQFTTHHMAKQLRLPVNIVVDVLEQLRADRWIEILGEEGAFNYRFAATGRGRERAARLMDICGYVGPAPVSLDIYISSLQQQLSVLPPVTREDVVSALSELVLPEAVVETAGLAASAGRSLLLYGPTGNGKTTIARHLHRAVSGVLWVPHCVSADGGIIRIFDGQCHRPVQDSGDPPQKTDPRWVCIERPFIVAGGELTMEALELSFHPQLRYYEAPLHFKANGGTFLIDDLGCQSVHPQKLLNRWIVPLEHEIDFFTLQTGQQIEVPFRQLLLFSTNLDPDSAVEAAILRRMGYRLFLDNPSHQRYTDIFCCYARKYGVDASGLLNDILGRYEQERRPLRSCEPRDLLERARDICVYRGEPFTLDADILDAAWRGYFGAHASDVSNRVDF